MKRIWRRSLTAQAVATAARAAATAARAVAMAVRAAVTAVRAAVTVEEQVVERTRSRVVPVLTPLSVLPATM